MKRIRSFFVALLLFSVFACTVHTILKESNYKVGIEDFGFLYNQYKDLSYTALHENINKETVLLMGSSEFRHGQKSKYHPKRMLANSRLDLLAVGGAGNQTLYHAIAVGALEKALKSKKVVLLISPSWFREKGVSTNHYSARFSGKQYIQFMSNNSINDQTKRYVARRNEQLTKKSAKQNSLIKSTNSKLLRKKKDIVTNFLFRTECAITNEKDRAMAAVAIKSIGNKSNSKLRSKKAFKDLSPDYFRKMEKEAIMKSEKHAGNPFDMMNRMWRKKYKKKSARVEGVFTKIMTTKSAEFDDLRVFFEVCKQTDIKAKLIILPVNGAWYDFLGTSFRKRKKVTERIVAMADEYKVDIADLSKYNYEPFITEDSVHPWKRGWVIINREIYDFCRPEKM